MIMASPPFHGRIIKDWDEYNLNFEILLNFEK